MLKLKKFTTFTRSSILPISQFPFTNEHNPIQSIPPRHPAQWSSNRFLDIFQMGKKAAIEKERARLKDELNRGYFADMSELEKHGGKVAMANKIIIPAMAAVKFPSLDVNFSDGTSLTLPITSNKNDANADKLDVPKVSLLCLKFRASSQAMTDSWSIPFVDAFKHSENIGLYEVSFVDSWFLSLSLIKKLLLRMMRKSSPNDADDKIQRQILYSFGDNYYFRKELKILNLLTGYVFLVDKFGRIRWQGFGLATKDELDSLLSCTSLLLEENLQSSEK